MSNSNDLVETFPEGSQPEVRVSAVEVYSDGSYGVLDVDGNKVRVLPVAPAYEDDRNEDVADG